MRRLGLGALLPGYLLVVVVASWAVVGARAATCSSNWAQDVNDTDSYVALTVSEGATACAAEAQRLAANGATQNTCTAANGVMDEMFSTPNGSVTREYLHLPLGCSAGAAASPASAASAAYGSASVVESVNRSTSATEALHRALLACGGVLCFGVGVFTGRQR